MSTLNMRILELLGFGGSTDFLCSNFGLSCAMRINNRRFLALSLRAATQKSHGDNCM
jgi:hypothetical protein